MMNVTIGRDCNATGMRPVIMEGRNVGGCVVITCGSGRTRCRFYPNYDREDYWLFESIAELRKRLPEEWASIYPNGAPF